MKADSILKALGQVGLAVGALMLFAVIVVFAKVLSDVWVELAVGGPSEPRAEHLGRVAAVTSALSSLLLTLALVSLTGAYVIGTNRLVASNVALQELAVRQDARMRPELRVARAAFTDESGIVVFDVWNEGWKDTSLKRVSLLVPEPGALLPREEVLRLVRPRQGPPVWYSGHEPVSRHVMVNPWEREEDRNVPAGGYRTFFGRFATPIPSEGDTVLSVRAVLPHDELRIVVAHELD